MTKKYLDIWIEEILRKHGFLEKHENISRQAIDKYQEFKLRETIAMAMEHSSFYQGRLEQAIDKICIQELTLDDMQRLPFTYPEDVKRRGMDMICTPMSSISRIVTLQTSGTTGRPKRIFFTEDDQRLTIDFFREGMKLLTSPGEKVFIGMPHNMPASIGDLLRRSLEEMGAATTYNIKDKGITCAVGIPEIMAQQAIKFKNSYIEEQLRQSLQTVLLSADFVSQENIDIIEKAWQCKVYEHYGMTEMGLGCAVGCGNGDGYHIRENDLYLEIIDPNTGRLQEPGKVGEIVFTTLTREGMPFIRYRTGDRSRWIEKPCDCGSVLKRIDRVEER